MLVYLQMETWKLLIATAQECCKNDDTDGKSGSSSQGENYTWIWATNVILLFRGRISFRFMRIKILCITCIYYIIQWETLILISGCYENHCKDRFSDFRRISNPAVHLVESAKLITCGWEWKRHHVIHSPQFSTDSTWWTEYRTGMVIGWLWYVCA